MRGKRIGIAWFLASCAYTGWQLYTGVSFVDRYVWVPSCSIAFSFGALVYHFRDAFPVIRSPWPAVAAAALWWLHVWLAIHMMGGALLYGLYTSLIFSAIAMITLMRLDPKQMPRWLARLDRLAGNLSYPIYLCHWGVAICLTALFPMLTRESFWVFVIGFPLVNLAAYTIYTYVEEPLQSWKLNSNIRRPAAVAVAPGGLRLDVASSAAPVGAAVARWRAWKRNISAEVGQATVRPSRVCEKAHREVRPPGAAIALPGRAMLPLSQPVRRLTLINSTCQEYSSGSTIAQPREAGTPRPDQTRR